MRFDYCGENALVDEIERSFRIDDRILKYMTILTDSTPDIEKIQAEITKAQEDERRAAEDSTSDESGVQAEPESGADEPVAAEAAAVDEPVVAEAAIDDSQKEDK